MANKIDKAIEQVKADPYLIRIKKERLVMALTWTQDHAAGFDFVRMEEAEVISATGRFLTAKVAVFSYKGDDLFSHTFVTDTGERTHPTVGKLDFIGTPIAPIPFSFIGFWQLGFRKLVNGNLMDSINLEL